MKVAVLGSGSDAQVCRALSLLEKMGAHVVHFEPEKHSFFVQKRALALCEEIVGRDRFYDLFRVVYRRGLSQHFLQEVEKGGGIPGFSEDDKEHLLEPGDVFVDVDIVVDGLNLRPSSKRPPLLNEGTAKAAALVFSGELQDMDRGEEFLKIVFVTEGGGDTFQALRDWEREKEERKLVVAGRQWPESLKVFFKEHECYFGYWPLSLDYLSDRKRGYLTLERPDFRGGEDMKTLEVDCVVFDSDLLPEKNPFFYRYGIRESERGYFLPDQIPSLLEGVRKLFSGAGILLALFFMISCARQPALKVTDVDQVYALSKAQEYFLPDLPDWANFEGGGHCRRKSNIKFFQYDKLHQSFAYSYPVLVQLQLLYNKRYREQRRRFSGQALTPQIEERLFFQVKGEILMGIYPFHLHQKVKKVQLLWMDPALNDNVYRQKLKRLLKGNKIEGAPVALISRCMSSLEMENFMQSLLGRSFDFLWISADMFSPFDRNFKLGLEFQFFVDGFFLEKEVIFYTLDGSVEPRFLKGSYKVKEID